MITVKLMGGTGNQMFQYAMARSLAYDLKTDFYLDVSFFNLPFLQKPKHNRYNLQHFNIKENLSSYNFLRMIKDKISTLNAQKYIEPNILSTFDNFVTINDGNEKIYLKGYWQNEKYFSHNEKLIKSDFKITTPPSKKNKSFIKEISEVNSVALLVRRGDYLKSYHKAQFGNSTLSYYKKAIDLVVNKIDNPVFYVFSDDPIWSSKHINIDYPTTYVSHNNVDNDYEDLRLISNCKHFIISNSTFHWWGAWLSSNDQKIVIAPTPWLNSYTCENTVSNKWTKVVCDRSELFNKYSKNFFEANNKFLKTNQKLKFNLPEYTHYQDKILKISIEFENPGILRMNFDNIEPIFLGYSNGVDDGKGVVDRYITLDKEILLNNFSIYNNPSEVNIKYLGINILSSKNSLD